MVSAQIKTTSAPRCWVKGQHAFHGVLASHRFTAHLFGQFHPLRVEVDADHAAAGGTGNADREQT